MHMHACTRLQEAPRDFRGVVGMIAQFQQMNEIPENSHGSGAV